jgi:hypothetical protein
MSEYDAESRGLLTPLETCNHLVLLIGVFEGCFAGDGPQEIVEGGARAAKNLLSCILPSYWLRKEILFLFAEEAQIYDMLHKNREIGIAQTPTYNPNSLRNMVPIKFRPFSSKVHATHRSR